MEYTLHPGDCLEIMPTLEASSVDCILADIPYGTTACKWDTVIPFAPMWECIKRVIKPRGAVVLFGSQPFTSALVMSNPKWFKYAWVWDKNRGNGHLVARVRPMQQTEDIAVFCNSSPVYSPQMVKRDKPRQFGGSPSQTQVLTKQVYKDGYTREDYTERYPINLLRFSWSNRDGLHPTQKPVDLMAYLIRTYTNPGETVLDFTMGSGTTGVAAIQEGRKFIGIEKDAGYFEIAQRRVGEATRQPALLEVA
jgi:site-specific DNA-methyltransferase (adenine-specific)